MREINFRESASIEWPTQIVRIEEGDEEEVDFILETVKLKSRMLFTLNELIYMYIIIFYTIV